MKELLVTRFVQAGLGLLVVGVVAAVVLSRSQSSAGFEDVPDLVATLEANGIECSDRQVSDIAVAETIGGQFGSCQVDGKTINIHVYFLEPDKVEQHIEGNVSVRGQSPTYFTSLVAGPNWVVDTYSVATTKKIQEVLGGDIH